MKPKEQRARKDGWEAAVELAASYYRNPRKANTLLSEMAVLLSSKNRRICQFLFMGVIRHLKLIEAIVGRLVKKNPGPELKARLFVAIYEIIERPEDAPKIVDFVVEKTKKSLSTQEANFVNAVLRKVPAIINEISLQAKKNSVECLAIQYSHPEWLIKRWIKAFGEKNTLALLDWDQTAPPVYIRFRENVKVPGLFKETKWPLFYEYHGDTWGEVVSLLDKGVAYIQDPSTRIPPELASVTPADKVLDLCAAPGGKSMILSEGLVDGKGQIVAVDLPGTRIDRLRENLAKLENVNYSILEKDVRSLSKDVFNENNLPCEYDVVLIDVPCSNTGVLRRRPDAKWRLKEADLKDLPHLQIELLEKASEFVREGGRLVYSTCSIEKEENEGVVKQFLEKHGDSFSLEDLHLSFPWESFHDGGGAFLLKNDL